jgi:hypothetical protein
VEKTPTCASSHELPAVLTGKLVNYALKCLDVHACVGILLQPRSQSVSSCRMRCCIPIRVHRRACFACNCSFDFQVLSRHASSCSLAAAGTHQAVSNNSSRSLCSSEPVCQPRTQECCCSTAAAGLSIHML